MYRVTYRLANNDENAGFYVTKAYIVTEITHFIGFLFMRLFLFAIIIDMNTILFQDYTRRLYSYYMPLNFVPYHNTIKQSIAKFRNIRTTEN